MADGYTPQHYPTPDGNGCVCGHYDSADCIASCSKNIRNHEVRYQYGRGVVTVTCSKGNVVLGCNIIPHVNIVHTTVGKCFTWAVKSDHSCECYGDDERGATCYALCGQIMY